MPEIRRGSTAPPLQVRSEPLLPSTTETCNQGDNTESTRPAQPHSQSADAVPVTLTSSRRTGGSGPIVRILSNQGHERRHKSFDLPNQRRSLSYAQRPDADAYYDSRAGTHREWERRSRTLQEYYDENPQLLPQLPFTWRHGKKRWRLILFAFLAGVDASAIPIALYYGLYFGGDVPEWIIFAVVTTIWGGPTYLEFGLRTLRLMKKERFYRPLGTDSRWVFDMTTWAASLTIFVVTVLFIVGSAPHDSWLRVLSMPAPSILWCLGGVLCVIDLYHYMGWKAPFRISSTPKGGEVLPGAYYFMEDVAAVNARAGRPFREALASRYKASPRFRQMLQKQSLFWGIPCLILAIPLTVIAVIPAVPEAIGYGVCWAVPFLWAAGWAVISTKLIQRDLRREKTEWMASESSDVELSEAKAEAQAEAQAIPPV